MSDLATLVAQFEGYYTAGSIANRNNNPGNLRYAPNQIGQENTVNGKFATFATPDDGWAALQNYIDSEAASGQTLRGFIYKYAPPTENDTSNYLNYLTSQLGVGADSRLSDVYESSNGYSVFGDSSLSAVFGDSGQEGLVALGIGIAVVAIIASR